MKSFLQWKNIPFITQLLFFAALVLVFAGVTLVFFSVNEERQQIGHELRQSLQDDLISLPATLQEALVIGDFASLEKQINNYVLRKEIFRVVFHDPSALELVSEDQPVILQAPVWFAQALMSTEIKGSTAINIGSRNYGDITITLTPIPAINRAWNKMQILLQVLLITLIVNLCGIWLLLRRGLRPLAALDQASQALAQGHKETRITPQGSPEFLRSILAFNHMAQALQENQEVIVRSRNDLQRFAEISAHHLQEPARRLVSYSQRLKVLLGELPNDDEARLSLEFIDQQARRQQRLLRDIQLYLAANQPRGDVECIDPAPLLERLQNRLESRLKEADCHIEHGKLLPVQLDAPRFTDILLTLLDNAINHGGKRPLHISISSEACGKRIRYCFADDGCGIPPEYRERVFLVFERLSSSHEGTGIGLAIVRQIALSVGGNAWIEESAGGGCSVYFELPQGEPS